MKKRIFIGSSSESIYVAKKIASGLKGIAEITLWTDAFEFGKSNYQNLISQIAFYDYAILVATADDVVTSRKTKFDSARDNVLFEFGLFAGGLGKEKAFYVIEKGIKIPSDLLGITLPSILKKTDKNFSKSVETCIEEIKKYIKAKENTFHLGLLPSTALAYGYFKNFVEKTVERLLEDKAEKKEFHLENKTTFKIKKLKFTVLIPDDLSDNMFTKVKAKRLKSGWQKLKVDPKDIRDYDFSIDVSKVKDGLLHLVDIPFTLNALNLALDFYTEKNHIGKNEKENLLERREIESFKQTLEYLIKKSAIAKKIVEVDIVEI